MKIENGGPAFPLPADKNIHGAYIDANTGMTMRQWYAGMALQGMLAGEPPNSVTKIVDSAYDAFRYADAMIEVEAKND